MRRLTALAIVAAILLPAIPARAGQQVTTPASEAAAYRQLALAIPLGSRVKVETASGHRLTATLMTVGEESILVKRETRVPEPAVTIRYDEIAQLKRDERKGGLSIGKALGIGLAAGAGAMLTLLGIAVSISD